MKERFYFTLQFKGKQVQNICRWYLTLLMIAKIDKAYKTDVGNTTTKKKLVPPHKKNPKNKILQRNTSKHSSILKIKLELKPQVFYQIVFTKHKKIINLYFDSSKNRSCTTLEKKDLPIISHWKSRTGEYAAMFNQTQTRMSPLYETHYKARQDLEYDF